MFVLESSIVDRPVALQNEPLGVQGSIAGGMLVEEIVLHTCDLEDCYTN